MPLLADYAITPDVFDVSSYTNEEECAARLDTIRETMLTEGLVRDLRDGEWGALFATDARPWHPRGTKLIKELATQGRLVRHEPELSALARQDRHWCAEALATHSKQPFTGGIIVTKAVKEVNRTEPTIARIDRLAGAPWWASRSPSVRLQRTRDDYEAQLDAVLRCSNSLIFIDPHLDPAKHRYRDFGALLTRAGRRAPVPKIEIHRVCYEGSGPERHFPTYFKRRFHEGLAEPLRTAGLRVEIFIWDDFHDRYLISNLIGISLPNGFDTKPNQTTTWNRLGRKDRDDVRREFHPATGSHKLQLRFEVR